MSVVTLPTRAAVDAAWKCHSELSRAAIVEPSLMLDRDHTNAMVRAWGEYRDLLLAMDRQC